MTIRQTVAPWMAVILLAATAQEPLRAQENFCWKASYTRGVGVLPQSQQCPPGTQDEGGLCYPACPANMKGVGVGCYGVCPAGFTDIGVSCAKPKAITTRLYTFQDRCEADNPTVGCYKSAGSFYANCPAGFKKVGDLVCSPICPDGFRDDGAFCAKPSGTRTVLTKVGACPPGTALDNGLCYTPCVGNYQGAGPVCWGQCTSQYPTQCGAGCATDKPSCGLAIADMTLSTINAAISFVSFCFGAAGVGPALKKASDAAFQTMAKASAQAAAKTASQAATKAAAQSLATTMWKDFIKPQNLVALGLNIGSNVGVTVAGNSINKQGTIAAMNRSAEDMGKAKITQTFDYNQLTNLDPTGLSAAVVAFAKYKGCDSDYFKLDTPTIELGNGNPTTAKTVKLTAMRPTRVTEIRTPAFTGCTIIPETDCLGRDLKPTESCNITVRSTGSAKINGEIRIYTEDMAYVPVPVLVNANGSAAATCPMHPTAVEAVNLTSLAGVWAWNGDNTKKIQVTSTGQINAIGNWTPPGTAAVRDGIARTFSLSVAGSTADATLSADGESLTSGALKHIRRPSDPRCDAGKELVAGLCYDTPIGYEISTPGIASTPCPDGWRDDGTRCFPNWTGPQVPSQADAEGAFTFKYPLTVTSCNLQTNGVMQCPANFVAGACTCTAKSTTKQLKSVIGSAPRN